MTKNNDDRKYRMFGRIYEREQAELEIFKQSVRKFWDRTLGVHYVKSGDIRSLLGLLGAFWLK